MAIGGGVACRGGRVEAGAWWQAVAVLYANRATALFAVTLLFMSLESILFAYKSNNRFPITSFGACVIDTNKARLLRLV